MLGMDLLSSSDSNYAPLCEVKIQGSDLEFSSIISVTVDEVLNAPSQFTIVLNEELNVLTRTYKWLDNPSSILSPGKDVEITMGYADGKKQCIIKGTINSLTPNFSFSNAPTLTVSGHDYLQKLQHFTSYKEIMKQNKTYSDIVKSLNLIYKTLLIYADPSPNSYPKIERGLEINDYELVKKFAEELEFNFFVQVDATTKQNTLFFKKPNEDSNPVKEFTYGKDIINFTPRLAGATLVKEVKVRVWLENNKKPQEVTAALSDVVTNDILSSLLNKYSDAQGTKIIEQKSIQTQAEATTYAKSKLKEIYNTFIQGDLECIGDPTLRPGKVIEISGIGKIFEGKYYITGVKNVFGNGYLTTLQVRKILL